MWYLLKLEKSIQALIRRVFLLLKVDLNRRYDNTVSHCELYPTNAGMSGKYTGHIPGR